MKENEKTNASPNNDHIKKIIIFLKNDFLTTFKIGAVFTSFLGIVVYCLYSLSIGYFPILDYSQLSVYLLIFAFIFFLFLMGWVLTIFHPALFYIFFKVIEKNDNNNLEHISNKAKQKIFFIWYILPTLLINLSFLLLVTHVKSIFASSIPFLFYLFFTIGFYFLNKSKIHRSIKEKLFNWASYAYSSLLYSSLSLIAFEFSIYIIIKFYSLDDINYFLFYGFSILLLFFIIIINWVMVMLPKADRVVWALWLFLILMMFVLSQTDVVFGKLVTKTGRGNLDNVQLILKEEVGKAFLVTDPGIIQLHESSTYLTEPLCLKSLDSNMYLVKYNYKGHIIPLEIPADQVLTIKPPLVNRSCKN